MGRTSQTVSAVLMTVVVAAALGGCGDKAAKQAEPARPRRWPRGAATEFAATLSKQVTTDAMMGHLTKLQEIANAHDGNRALGTAGYDASVDYVAKALRDKGFDVQTPEFEVRLPFADDPQLTVGGAAIAAKPLQFTIGTPPDGRLRAAGRRPRRGLARLHRVGLRRPARPGSRGAGRPRHLPVLDQTVRRRRARRGGADRRQQRGRRRDGRHTRRGDPTRRSRSSASPRHRASGCAPSRATPPSSSTPGSASSTPATSSPRPRPARPPTW